MSSSTNSDNNNNEHRVDPRFFGSPSLYQPQQQKKKSNDKTTLMPPPGTGWEPSAPPPPYTPSEPESSHASDVYSNPSAPPLEEDNYSIGITGGFVRPTQPQQTRSYPIYPRYNQYGALTPTNLPIQHNNTGDVVSWPWHTPPSTTTVRPPPPVEYQPNKKESTFCERSFKYIFGFLFICVLLRILGIIEGFTLYEDGSCGRGTSWVALPKQFSFDESLIVRVVSGSLTNGHITLKTITDQVIEEEKVNGKGLVKMSTVISPNLAHHPDMKYSIINWSNGTVLELYIPESSKGSGMNCVNFNAVIYVPPHAGVIRVEVQNTRIEVIDETIQVEELVLSTTNRAIEFYPELMGATDLMLLTTNGHIEINRPVSVSRIFIASTKNGAIRARAPVKADSYAVFLTTNGAIDVDVSVEGARTELTTTNSRITVNNLIAQAVQLKTTNGRIQVDHSTVRDMIDIQSSNAPATIRVDKGMINGDFLLRTTNGAATVYMPWDHEGTFELNTSSYSKVSIYDPLGWSILRAEDHRITGLRYAPDSTLHDARGHIQVITTNAKAHLEFANKP